MANWKHLAGRLLSTEWKRGAARLQLRVSRSHTQKLRNSKMGHRSCIERLARSAGFVRSVFQDMTVEIDE
jgi:hypothetical protein